MSDVRTETRVVKELSLTEDEICCAVEEYVQDKYRKVFAKDDFLQLSFHVDGQNATGLYTITATVQTELYGSVTEEVEPRRDIKKKVAKKKKTS